MAWIFQGILLSLWRAKISRKRLKTPRIMRMKFFRTLYTENNKMVSICKIYKSTYRGLQPTQAWVGMVLTAVDFEIWFLLWNPIVVSNIYFKGFLIKWKLWKFIISRYDLCSKIWSFQVIINFCNFASKYTNFWYVTQNGWLS